MAACRTNIGSFLSASGLAFLDWAGPVVSADACYCFRIPGAYSDVEAASLLCAGLIGYHAQKMAGNADRVRVYGLGAAAHIVA